MCVQRYFKRTISLYCRHWKIISGNRNADEGGKASDSESE